MNENGSNYWLNDFVRSLRGPHHSPVKTNEKLPRGFADFQKDQTQRLSKPKKRTERFQSLVETAQWIDINKIIVSAILLPFR